MQPVLLASLVGILAFVVGFATQRGSICSVLAARQIVETGKASRLVAFVTASLWALALAVPLHWIAASSFMLSPSYAATAVTVLGGALYGLGTIVNGGCVFGTVGRIASGRISFLTALPGIALGAGLGARAVTTRSPDEAREMLLGSPSPTAVVVLILAVVLIGRALAGLIRSHRRAGLGVRRALSAGRWRTSLAMMIIGLVGGLLFATGQPWSYPAMLRQVGNAAFGAPSAFAAITIIGPLATFVGAIAGAALGGRFIRPRLEASQLARSFIGGSMMGFAGALVPGGNDALLLSALPSLAAHGAVAAAAMLAVQLALCALARQWKTRGDTVLPRKRTSDGKSQAP